MYVQFRKHEVAVNSLNLLNNFRYRTVIFSVLDKNKVRGLTIHQGVQTRRSYSYLFFIHRQICPEVERD